MTEPADERSHAIALIDAASNLGGAIVGAALGLIGGPAGAFGSAALGVAASDAFRRVGYEFHQRFLAPREEQRIGVTLAGIIVNTAGKVEAGDELRADGYFDQGEHGHSGADELLEAVLQRAARTYQERKLPYIAHLWPSVATTPDISPSYGQLLAQIAEDLTYDGLIALAVIHNNDDPLLGRKRFADVGRADGGPPRRDPAVVAEFDRLAALGLVAALDPNTQGAAAMPIYRFVASGFREIGIRQAVLTHLGERLWKVLDLMDVPQSEQIELLRRLSYGLSDGPTKFAPPDVGQR